MRITGDPVVRVQLSTTHDDGALYVYLEDVSPEGVVTYITEGQLRFVHRAPGASPIANATDPHSYRARDLLPVIPDEPMELVVRLRPTSVRLEAGHRVRIALAGHDEANFVRLPTEGTPTWTVHHSAAEPAQLVLPVAR